MEWTEERAKKWACGIFIFFVASDIAADVLMFQDNRAANLVGVGIAFGLAAILAFVVWNARRVRRAKAQQPTPMLPIMRHWCPECDSMLPDAYFDDADLCPICKEEDDALEAEV